MVPDRTGTYVGTLSIDYEFVNFIGIPTSAYCSTPITLDVDPTASPAVMGSAVCDLSGVGLGTTTVMNFTGTIPTDPDLLGQMEVNDVVAFSGTVNGVFDLDNLTAGVSGAASFIGGDLTWQGTITADR